MSFNLLKLLKFKSFCNVNQHYLITPPPSSPSPSSPSSPLLPNFPLFLGGAGEGTGGLGRGRGEGDGEGTIAPPPPLNEGGGTKSPPFSPTGFYKKLFYPGSFINILLFSL